MSDDLLKISGIEESAKDQQIAKIENDLQAEKDSRHTERFVWSLSSLVLLDMIAFPHIAWDPSIGIMFFQLILLIVVARLCGVNDVYTIMQNASDTVSAFWPKGGEKKE